MKKQRTMLFSIPCSFKLLTLFFYFYFYLNNFFYIYFTYKSVFPPSSPSIPILKAHSILFWLVANHGSHHRSFSSWYHYKRKFKIHSFCITNKITIKVFLGDMCRCRHVQLHCIQGGLVAKGITSSFCGISGSPLTSFAAAGSCTHIGECGLI